MNTATSVTRLLGITHQVPGLSGHAERLHPHLWTVRAEWEGDPIAGEGFAVVTDEEISRYRSILAEYQGTSLNDTMASGIPTLEGFGLHLMERCAQIRGLKRIAVYDAHHNPAEQRTFIVER